MRVEAVKEQLTGMYPGINIKETTINDDGVATELVGEIDRQLVGSERDVAVVVADRSSEHLHRIITEEYEVIKGSLKVYRNDVLTELKPGEKIVINPNTRHWVEGDETWFFCYSVPDWFPGDFYQVEDTPA